MNDPEKPPRADKDNEDNVELDPQTRDAIGEQLKNAYADILSEPVPDRFRELLDRLEAGDASEEADNQ